MTNEKVRTYYNEIAQTYDNSRFENTYGDFIDRQERKLIEKHLTTNLTTLNLGCGTGRFMEYSTHGLDFSVEMLKVAEKQHPNKSYHVAEADTTPFENNSFDQIICFHVIMHLSPKETAAIFREVNRILKPGGTFIFDYPSAERRKLTRYKAKNWHGGNHFKSREMRTLIQKHHWITKTKRGVLFLPIHQFSTKIRKLFFPLDQLAARSPVKRYSSYLIQVIQKPAHA